MTLTARLGLYHGPIDAMPVDVRPIGAAQILERYLEPRANTIAAWFANTADLGLHGDAKGSWARFFIFADPQSAVGAPTTLAANSYTRPGDAAHNQRYREGDYPHLEPAPVP